MKMRRRKSPGSHRVAFLLASDAPRVCGQLESLEDRTLLSNITWSGSGDGTSWNVAANWIGGQVPGAGDDVVIAAPNGTTIQLSGNISIRSLNTANNIDAVPGTNLQIGGQNCIISGRLTFNRGTISVQGSGVQFTATGASSSIDGSSLYVSGGATLSIPRCDRVISS